MKRLGISALPLVAAAALCGVSPGAHATPTDIALGAPVSIAATDSDAGTGFNNGTSANLQNITNGTILPDSTPYGSSAATSQAIEWNGNGYVFQIDLSQSYTLTGIIVDADDNDAYVVQYMNPNTSTWDLLYDAPIVSQGFGFRTRPDTGDQSQEASLPNVTTDAVRIYGAQSNDNECFGNPSVCGQGGYGVAQVELFGSPASTTTSVPEPSSLALLGAGLIGLFGLCSRRKAA